MKKNQYIKPEVEVTKIILQSLLNTSLRTDKQNELSQDEDFLGNDSHFSVWADDEEE